MKFYNGLVHLAGAVTIKAVVRRWFTADRDIAVDSGVTVDRSTV